MADPRLDGKWTVEYDPEVHEWIHIVPANDLVEHQRDTTECICNPRLFPDDLIVCHASLDRREAYETGALT